MNVDFTRKLLKWNADQNRRSMPWKGETDPYKIWLSEVILQQTRVEQGMGYYERFIKAFPTVYALAAAPEKTVYKMWEGLGYYSRCRNLISSAETIVKEYNGVFPSTYEDILKLKGIGPYTAAAIASFAFNECRAAVDGNVLRVISRYFGISTPIDDIAGKKMYNNIAQSLIDPKLPGMYNQAIMDFGATVCKPRNPLCQECVQSAGCEAFRNGHVQALPIKAKSLKKRTRWFFYFLIEIGDSVYIRKRSAKDIWQNLNEFILLETDEAEAAEDPSQAFLKRLLKRHPFTIRLLSKVYTQQLTHQRVYGRFILVHLPLQKEVNGNSQSPADSQTIKDDRTAVGFRQEETGMLISESDGHVASLQRKKDNKSSLKLNQSLLEEEITSLLLEYRGDKDSAGLIGYQLVKKKELHEYAFPKLIHSFVEDSYTFSV